MSCFVQPKNHRPKHATQTLRRLRPGGHQRPHHSRLAPGRRARPQGTDPFPEYHPAAGRPLLLEYLFALRTPLRGTARRRPRRGRNRLGRHRHLGRRFRLRRQGRLAAGTPLRLPRPAHRRRPRGVFLQGAAPGGGLRRDGHPDHAIQFALPALRHAARPFVAAGRRRAAALHARRPVVSAHRGDGHRIHHRLDLAAAESPHEAHRSAPAGENGPFTRTLPPDRDAGPPDRHAPRRTGRRLRTSAAPRNRRGATTPRRPSPPCRPPTNVSPTSRRARGRSWASRSANPSSTS